MHVITRQSIVLLALSFISAVNSSIHAETLWQEKSKQSQIIKPTRAMADNARYLQINQSLLNNTFSDLSLATEMSLPLPNGLSISVTLSPSPILSNDLAQKYPHFMTYQAQQVGQPNNIGRFSISHLGLFGFFRYQNQWMLLSPRYINEADEYASYWYKDGFIKSDTTSLSADFLLAEIQPEEPKLAQKSIATDAVVRTYKLAISTTAEYTQKLGGTAENVVAELMNLVNRINQILLVDLGLQFELVDNQDIIFFDATSDPFTNSDAATDIENNQDTVDQAIGSQNYDIGHVLGTNEGGLAYVGVVCNSQFKAQGYTGLSNPQGERFYIDLVAHELGHQLGAGHSFNATKSSSCEQGQRNSSSAYEPGGGSTIMSYAGICDAQNIQNNSDPYFHSISIQNIRDYVESNFAQDCGVDVDINNTIPQIQLAQNAYSIPANTPFVLSGSATDEDNDLLTYTWEQFDNGGTLGATASLAQLNSDNGHNPLFRSFPPIDIAQRYFPKLGDVLADQTSLGETYATTDRDMHFRLTARDNKGGVNQQDVVVTVVTNKQTFSIDTPTEWQALSEQEVTWDIGDTLDAPINCANVDIMLIADTNNPILTTVQTQTPNDGQQNINVPNVTSDAARLVLKCSDNVFYATSVNAFTIIEAVLGAPVIDSQNTISLNEDSARQIDFSDLNVSDLDSDYPQDFTLTIQDGDNYSVNQQTLTPDANFNGALSVSVIVNDGESDSNVFILQVQVVPVNDAPIASSGSGSTISLNEDSARKIDFSDLSVSDPDSAYPEDFTLTVQDGDNYSISQQVLTPDANFNGALSVSVFVNDGELDSNIITLQIQVIAVNDAPVANDDTLSIQQDQGLTTIDVLANDNDIDMDTLSLASFTYTGQGQVAIQDQQLTYTPAAQFTGSESIVYVVSDGTLTAQASLNIKVSAVVVPPSDSGGGSMLLLSILSFLGFSVKLCARATSRCKDSYE